MPELQQFLWNKLNCQEQHALRCTCRDLQRLAREALVTQIDVATNFEPADHSADALERAVLEFASQVKPGVGREEVFEDESFDQLAWGAAAVCLTGLRWCAERYAALEKVTVNCPHSATTCTLLGAALRPAARTLQKLSLRLGTALSSAECCRRGPSGWNLSALPRALCTGALQLTSLTLHDVIFLHGKVAKPLADALHGLRNLTELRLLCDSHKDLYSEEDEIQVMDAVYDAKAYGEQQEQRDNGAALMSAIASLPALRMLEFHSVGVWVLDMEAFMVTEPTSLAALQELRLFNVTGTFYSTGDDVLEVLARRLAAGAAPVLRTLCIEDEDGVIPYLCRSGALRAIHCLEELALGNCVKLEIPLVVQLAQHLNPVLPQRLAIAASVAAPTGAGALSAPAAGAVTAAAEGAASPPPPLQRLQRLRLWNVDAPDNTSAFKLGGLIPALPFLCTLEVNTSAKHVSAKGIRAIIDAFMRSCNLKAMERLTMRVKEAQLEAAGGEEALKAAWRVAPHLAGAELRLSSS